MALCMGGNEVTQRIKCVPDDLKSVLATHAKVENKTHSMKLIPKITCSYTALQSFFPPLILEFAVLFYLVFVTILSLLLLIFQITSIPSVLHFLPKANGLM